MNGPLAAALLVLLAAPGPARALDLDGAALARRAEEDLLRSEGCLLVDVAIEEHLRYRGQRATILGAVRATLDEGTWTVLGTRIDDRQGDPILIDFGEGHPLLLPIFGRHRRPDGSVLEQAHTRQIVAALRDAVEVEGVTPTAEGGAVLERTFRVRRRLWGEERANTMVAEFDAAGRTRRWHLRVELPVRGSQGTLRRLEVELEVDADGVPVREVLDLRTGQPSQVQRTAVVLRQGPCPTPPTPQGAAAPPPTAE